MVEEEDLDAEPSTLDLEEALSEEANFDDLADAEESGLLLIKS